MKQARKKVLKIVLLTLIAATALSVAAWELNSYLNQRVRLVDYTFSRSTLPASFDGYKLMVISDLHNAEFSDMIIAHIEKSEPDMIVLLGDMVQLPMWDFDQIAAVAESVEGRIPIYAVSGNHETQNKEYYYIRNELSYLGVNWLENDSTVIEKNGDRIILAGIKDPKYDAVPTERCLQIAERIKDEFITTDDFALLLSHRAGLYPYIKDSGAELILSGHLHGGLIKLPFVGGIINEDGQLGCSDYSYGYVQEGISSAMIVSGGCDNNPDKLRWFNPPEVLLVTLCTER